MTRESLPQADLMFRNGRSYATIDAPKQPLTDIESRRDTVKRLLDQTRISFPNIPDDVFAESKKRMQTAFEEYLTPEETLTEKGINAAFLIHTRRMSGGMEELDDATRCFPMFDKKYGIPDDRVEQFWDLIPPHQIGSIKGILPDGSQYHCAIISVPITPAKLEEAAKTQKSASKGQITYGRPRIEDSAQFAYRLGARTIGLGETLASLTHHGKKVDEMFQEQGKNVKIATGHTFTSYYIREWTRFGVFQQGVNSSEASVTIVGGAGTIGSTTAQLLAEDGIGRIVLYDLGTKKGSLEKNADDLRTAGYKGEIQIVYDDEHLSRDEALTYACYQSKIIVSAASAAEPFIKAHNLQPNTVFIEDSQPPSILRKDAEGANCKLYWVVGRYPQGIIRNFDYGLYEEVDEDHGYYDVADWTCALEILAAHMYGDELETTGAVTLDKVKTAEKIIKKAGFTLSIPQSFGEPVLDSSMAA